MRFSTEMEVIKKIFDTKVTYKSIVISAYFLVLWIVFYQVANSGVQVFPDSRLYMNLSEVKSLKESFFTVRPVGSIIEFKLFGDASNFPFLQSIIYTSSILFLLYVLAGVVKNKLVFICSAIFSVLFFTHSNFTLWLTTALTETVFFSFMILELAFLLGVMFKKGFCYAVCAAIGVVAISLLRDFGAYYAALYGVLFGLAFLLTKDKIVLLPVVAAVVIFIFSGWSADQNARWHFSMLNNIGKRIIVSEEYRGFFSRNGMPSNEALIDKSGIWASGRGPSGLGFYDDPGLVDFMGWFRDKSKNEYMKFLLSNPRYSIGSLFIDRDVVFFGGHDFVRQYGAKGYKKFDFGVGNFYGLVYFVAVFAFFIGVILFLRRELGSFRFYFLGLTYFAFIFPFAFVGYHADAMEVPRHLLPVLFHSILSALLFFVLFDRLIVFPKKTTVRDN